MNSNVYFTCSWEWQPFSVLNNNENTGLPHSRAFEAFASWKHGCTWTRYHSTTPNAALGSRPAVVEGYTLTRNTCVLLTRTEIPTMGICFSPSPTHAHHRNILATPQANIGTAPFAINLHFLTGSLLKKTCNADHFAITRPQLGFGPQTAIAMATLTAWLSSYAR